MARRDPSNIADFWLDRARPGLSLMRADFRTQAFAPHRHEGFVVAVTEEGGSVIKSRGQVEQADSRTLFVFNPDEPHAGWMGASRRWLYRSLYVEEDALARLAAALGLERLPGFVANMFDDRDLIEGFLALHRALQRGEDALAEDQALVSLFGALFARHGGARSQPASRDRRRVGQALDFIRAHAGEPLSLDAIAAAAETTPFQLIRIFKRATGLTPHAFVTQIRLDAARRRLTQGEAIADVALAAGFYDQSALTRHFKRCYGVTPAQYARAARA